MAAILKAWRRIEIENPTSSIDVCIYVKNTHVKFHPDPIWNDGALGFLKSSPQEEQEDWGPCKMATMLLHVQ